MLPEFDLVNMNGRLYEPVLGVFLSPDNYVQDPDNSQNYNRYSYCLNNPLKYTDPSGELFGIDDAIIAFAAFNIANSMMRAAFTGQSVWKAGAFSLLSSAASYGIGAAFGGMGNFGHELLQAGAHGMAGGVVAALNGGNFISSFVSGAMASGIGSYAQSINMNSGLMIASTTAMGGMAAWATGSDFMQGAMQGMMIGAFNHAMHDGEKTLGRPIKHEVLQDGTIAITYELDEVIVYGSHKLTYNPPHPIEKPLKAVYPEFAIMTFIRASFNGVLSLVCRNGQVASLSHKRNIEFGNNPNSNYHTFRHTDKMGLDRDIVRKEISKDFKTIDNIPLNTAINRVVSVSGRKIQYTIYRRQMNENDIYNVGRIHKAN